MKKITTILAVFMISTASFAQGVSGGAKLGLNFADITNTGNGTASSPQIKANFHVGGYLTWMFTEHLGLQPELLYSGQGAKNGSYKLNLSYVNVPILVRFNVNKLLSFHLGPQIGLLVGAKSKSGSASTDVKDQFKSTDVGVAAGVTIDLPMKLNFTFRVIKGLTDINDYTTTVTTKNFNMQLSVGYRLFGK